MLGARDGSRASWWWISHEEPRRNRVRARRRAYGHRSQRLREVSHRCRRRVRLRFGIGRGNRRRLRPAPWRARRRGSPRRSSRGSASSIRRTTTRTARRPFRRATWSSSSTPTPGITGVGQGGSPDTVRNVARSVIGKNAFDTEMIWQAAFMDGFYSPGKERLHALGAIDLALWDIKGKALNVPLYQLFGGKAREHIELYATSGLPQGLVPPAEAAAMGLKERAAATMAAGYRVYRVDSGILPSTGRAGAAPRRRRSAGRAAVRRRRSRRPWRLHLRFAIAHPADHPGARADPRRRRPGRQLDDRPAPEVRLPRGRRSLQAHGAAPAVLRRGPGSRGAVPHADPEAAAADDACRWRPARSGGRGPTSARSSSSATSTSRARRCRTSAASPRCSRSWRCATRTRSASCRTSPVRSRPPATCTR